MTLITLAFYLVLGSVITLFVILYQIIESRPNLDEWHKIQLTNEFNVKSKVQNFDEYLKLEADLFTELEQKKLVKSDQHSQYKLNRFNPNSLSSPAQWPTNWNKSFEFTTDKPKAAVLLLHGLSDSPYSIRQLAQTLHRNQAHVIGLRLPGHGTVPSALLKTTWQDMAQAVELATTHLQNKAPNVPIYIVGYSNGAALALNFVLQHLNQDINQSIKGLVLLSPEIGVSRLARYAFIQEKLGDILGLEKFAWVGIQPEYNPYKYNSFALNAAIQAHQITSHLKQQLLKLNNPENLKNLPPIICFQSIVDDTVQVEDLLKDLYLRLKDPKHHLYLFDINRNSKIQSLIDFPYKDEVMKWLVANEKHFTTHLVTNISPSSQEVVAIKRNPVPEYEQFLFEKQELELYWPKNVFSLSHVAIPFPKEDPLFGEQENSYGIQLGGLALYGEHSILQIPAKEILRLRWNPFYGYMEDKILSFTGLQY